VVDTDSSLYEQLEEKLVQYTPKSRLNRDNYYASVAKLPRENVPGTTEKQVKKCLNGNNQVDFGVIYRPKGVRFSAPGLPEKENQSYFIVRMTGGPHDFNGDHETFGVLHYAVFEDSVYQLYADGAMRGLTYFWKEIGEYGLIKQVVEGIKEGFVN